MNDKNDDTGAPKDPAEESVPENFFIDILTGEKLSPSPKKLLVQKVLRQLIESYGFDRNDIEVDYKHAIKGGKPAKIDIAIFHSDAEHTNDSLQRVIVCKPQKKRDKLRSITEAETDLCVLKDLLELIPGATLGMWTNGQEEFLFQVERSRFEVRPKPLGVWPVPGEATSDLDKTGGGGIQVAADVEGLEDALLPSSSSISFSWKNALSRYSGVLPESVSKTIANTASPGGNCIWLFTMALMVSTRLMCFANCLTIGR